MAFEYNLDELLEANDVVGISTMFRGMLDQSINLGVIDVRQRNMIWLAWQNWEGGLSKFVAVGMKPFLKPTQYKNLIRRIFPRG